MNDATLSVEHRLLLSKPPPLCQDHSSHATDHGLMHQARNPPLTARDDSREIASPTSNAIVDYEKQEQ
jgi:hypothetical protein